MAKEIKELNISRFINDVNTDPTYLSFDFKMSLGGILFSQNEDSSSVVTAEWDSLLNSFGNNADSVLCTPHILLKNLGETKRDKLWMRFIKELPQIFTKQQWRVQAIEGLDTVFAGISNFSDGYRGSGDEKVTITCIEDIDLTMYNLFEIYRQCVYDNKYRRQLIPNNLLQFECLIDIKDKRNLIYDTPAENSRLKYGYHNEDTSKTEDASNKKSTKDKLINGISVVRGGITDLTNTMKSAKTPFQQYTDKRRQIEDAAYPLPTVRIWFHKCTFDLSSIGKMFETIDPGEGDNTWAKYSFSFKYGWANMYSSTVDEWKASDEIEEKSVEDPNTARLMAEGYTTNGKGATMESLISGGWDGALNAAKEKGQEYLDKLIDKGTSKLESLSNSILGKEQGYEVGQNIYGESNFISAFASGVGDKLTALADEGIAKLENATVGKAREVINTQKAKAQNAINNATSAIMGDGPSKSSGGSSTVTTPNIGKLTKNEKVAGYSIEKKESDFEEVNIYENLPSGPNQ